MDAFSPPNPASAHYANPAAMTGTSHFFIVFTITDWAEMLGG